MGPGRRAQSCMRRRISSRRPSSISLSFLRASDRDNQVKNPTRTTMRMIGMLSGLLRIAEKLSHPLAKSVTSVI